MSWWDIGSGNVMGDAPADALGGLLAALGDNVGGKPSLSRLLGGVRRALDESAGSLVEDPDAWRRHTVVADLDDGRHIEAEGDGPGVQSLVPAIRHALERTRAAYEREQKRRPRLAEVVDCLEFVIGGNLSEYISDTAGMELARIRIVERQQ